MFNGKEAIAAPKLNRIVSPMAYPIAIHTPAITVATNGYL